MKKGMAPTAKMPAKKNKPVSGTRVCSSGNGRVVAYNKAYDYVRFVGANLKSLKARLEKFGWDLGDFEFAGPAVSGSYLAPIKDQPRHGGNHPWPEWLKELGWVPRRDGSGGSTFHGAGGYKKPKAPKEWVPQTGRRNAGKASAYGAGQKDKSWKAPTEGAEEKGTACVVPGCKFFSKKPFEARGVRGMEAADGKNVCYQHAMVLVDISRARVEAAKKAELVKALLERGEEPDEKVFAVAAVPKARRIEPVGEIAPAVRVPVQTAPKTAPKPAGFSENGSVPCLVCKQPADGGPRFSWKNPRNPICKELMTIVATDAHGRVCKACLMAVLHVSDLVTDVQPVTLSALRDYVAKNKAEFRGNGKAQNGNVVKRPEPAEKMQIQPVVATNAPPPMSELEWRALAGG